MLGALNILERMATSTDEYMAMVKSKSLQTIFNGQKNISSCVE